MFVLVCGPADGPESRRYVFGRLDAGPDITYAGPDAVGHGAADGLFLFALLPGAVGADAMIEIDAGRTGGSVGVRGRSFSSAVAAGERQHSGCYVAG